MHFYKESDIQQTRIVSFPLPARLSARLMSAAASCTVETTMSYYFNPRSLASSK
jgi:hypothetical protein